MLFSELYSVYYNAVAAILKDVLTGTGEKTDIRGIAQKHAFGESFITIEKALKNGDWPLINSDGTTPIRNIPEMPLTLLQKQWLLAVFSDPRVKLFTDFVPDFPGVEPLYRQDDICVFDKYSDGDDYTDENYIRNFRLILDAVKCRKPLYFELPGRRGTVIRCTAQPEKIEYSEKDDKFRVLTSGSKYIDVINIGRIIRCEPGTEQLKRKNGREKVKTASELILEVTDERNTLERVLLHFAHFEKEAEKTDGKHFRVSIKYDANDETEILIRVLSFGPFVRVTGPDSFKELIKDRLKSQKSCGLS